MKVKIIPYEPHHIDEIMRDGARERTKKIAALSEWQDWKRIWKEKGPAHTILVDQKVLLCAGVMLMNWNRGEVWMVGSKMIKKYQKTTFSSVKKYLDMIIKEFKLRRVQGLVEPDFEEGKRFLEHLGFRLETEKGMQAYGPYGEDILLYGRRC